MASAQGYVTALYVSIGNFAPRHRGKIVGLVASFFGISATMVSIIYTHGFSANTASALSSFFVLFACLMAFVNFLGAAFLRKVELTDQPEEFEGVQLDGFDAVDGDDEEESETNAIKTGASQSADTASAETPYGKSSDDEAPHALLKVKPLPFFQTVCLLFKDGPYRIVYLQFAVSAGAGLFVINNLGSMQQSLSTTGEHDKGAVEELVISLSVCNMMGRLIAGNLLDLGVPALHGIMGCTLLLSLACLVTLFLSVGYGDYLILVAIGTGLGYGGLWSLCPAMLAERYGIFNFGKIFGLTTTAPAFTSFLFNEVFASWVYEAHISTDHEEDGVCLGTSCFMLSCLVIGGLGVAAAFVPLLTTWAT